MGKKRRAVIVMEEALGTPIPRGFHVHHIDGDEANDDLDNLALVTAAGHNRIHHTGVKNSRKANRPNRKVNRDIVEEVKRLRKLGHSQEWIGNQVGLHQTMVSRILAGKPLESRL